MGDITVIAVLFFVALAILVAEVFIPSHGILSIAGVTFLVIAIVKTFAYGERAGFLAILGSVTLFPIVLAIAIRMWPRTSLGRAVAPENPVILASDLGVDVPAMRAMVGRTGTALSPLRPIGTCDFEGRRFQCLAEMGMVEPGTAVRVVGVRGSSLLVAPRQESSTA